MRIYLLPAKLTQTIRIFAGDDLRFQLNADGLYAFKNSSISGGEADYSNYVVHNSEGLFLTNVKDNGEKINRVEISWDGLILRNNSGDTVFNADNDGNLTIVGNIQAATVKLVDGIYLKNLCNRKMERQGCVLIRLVHLLMIKFFGLETRRSRFSMMELCGPQMPI